MSAPGKVDLDASVEVSPPAPLYGPVQCGRFTPAEVAAIAARVAHGQLPWWQRWTRRAPEGWR